MKSKLNWLSVDLEVKFGHLFALIDAEVVERYFLAGEEATEELLRDTFGVLTVGILELSTNVALNLFLFYWNVVHY
jgi:hypothetical protein